MSLRRGLMMGMSGQCGMKLLSTITPTTGTNLCQIPLDNTWLAKYTKLILYCDFSFTPATSNEWVYFIFNNTNYSAGTFTVISTETKNSGRIQCIVSAIIDNRYIKMQNMSNITSYTTYSLEQNNNFLCMRLYSYKFNEGSYVKLYGIA